MGRFEQRLGWLWGGGGGGKHDMAARRRCFEVPPRKCCTKLCLPAPPFSACCPPAPLPALPGSHVSQALHRWPLRLHVLQPSFPATQAAAAPAREGQRGAYVAFKPTEGGSGHRRLRGREAWRRAARGGFLGEATFGWLSSLLAGGPRGAAPART